MLTWAGINTPLARGAPWVAPIPYTIVSERRNPMGYVRVIVVSHQYDDEADLRALARQLVELAAPDPWAIYVVFDNARAARMYPEPDDAVASFYDRHLLLTFNKNASGSQIAITPKGIEGPQIDVTP